MNRTAKVPIRRKLTETPLARLHARGLETTARTRPVIPWSRFDRTTYPAPALKLAAQAHCALALGEYGAVHLFSRLSSMLSLFGAPLDLVAAASKIPSDEIRHAELALHMASLLAADEPRIEIDREPLENVWRNRTSLERLDHTMIELAAIGETLAAALIGACRDRASDPVLRTLFTSILGDEIHHARLGWYYLMWRSPEWTNAERQRAADLAGSIVARAERRFWHGRDAPRGSRKAARALGVLDGEGQRRTIRDVMEDEIVPALDALGLGASHAWNVRDRGPAA
jgi:hypothetical protein